MPFPLTHLDLQELGDVEDEGAEDGRDDVLERARQRCRLDEGDAVAQGVAHRHIPAVMDAPSERGRDAGVSYKHSFTSQ